MQLQHSFYSKWIAHKKLTFRSLPNYGIHNCGMATATLHLTARLTCNLVMHVGILRLHACKYTHTDTNTQQLHSCSLNPSYFSCCLLRLYPHAQLSHSVFLLALHSHIHTHVHIHTDKLNTHTNVITTANPGRANSEYKGMNRCSLPHKLIFNHFIRIVLQQDACLNNIANMLSQDTSYEN